jgi:hypothetical protein
MTQNQQPKQINLKRLVSNAKAIVTNQIALPLGVRKMNKIRYWINHSKTVVSIDFKNAAAIYKEDILNKCLEIIELLDSKK